MHPAIAEAKKVEAAKEQARDMAEIRRQIAEINAAIVRIEKAIAVLGVAPLANKALK